MEVRHALELVLSKAQKQAEDWPVVCQIEVTKEFIARAKKPMLVADEKNSFAQVPFQDVMEEKEYDIREVPLAEARLDRLQTEIVPPRQTPPISTDLEAEVHRLRTLLAQMEASQSNLCRHPPQSSSQAADMLRERAAKRRAGVRIHPPKGKTSNVGCQRSKAAGVNLIVDGSHPQRSGAVPKGSTHGDQHGFHVRTSVVAII